jgi:hypothetical protein
MVCEDRACGFLRQRAPTLYFKKIAYLNDNLKMSIGKDRDNNMVARHEPIKSKNK